MTGFFVLANSISCHHCILRFSRGLLFKRSNS
jgi:hypothetical protein